MGRDPEEIAAIKAERWRKARQSWNCCLSAAAVAVALLWVFAIWMKQILGSEP